MKPLGQLTLLDLWWISTEPVRHSQSILGIRHFYYHYYYYHHYYYG